MNLKEQFESLKHRYGFDEEEAETACHFTAEAVQLQADYLKEHEPTASNCILELTEMESKVYHAVEEILDIIDNDE